MIYSDDFLLLLTDINKNKPCIISKYLMEIKEEKRDITYIDVNFENELITFVSENKLNILLNNFDKNIKDLEEFDTSWKNKFINKFILDKSLIVTSIKIGRFINKISNFSDKEIEIFVNTFKGFLKFKKDIYRFKLVKGEEIRKYYLADYYFYNKGQLNESCMKDPELQKCLDIYTSNTEICSLLILKGFNTEKIMGRALIWTISDGRKYLDRVYTNLDSDMIFIEEYAKILGCFISYDFINTNKIYLRLTIKPVHVEFDFYPYMDTFKYYYPLKKSFYSEILLRNNNYYELGKNILENKGILTHI